MAENHQHAWHGPLALLFIVCCAFWKITLPGSRYTWLDSPDLVDQVLPWLNFEAVQVHQGAIPLWDPHEAGGESLIGQMQPGAANPLNWVLISLPLENGRIRIAFVDAYFVLIHYLAALFCYWLCRDLGRTVIASVFGGAIFALGGWIGYTDWPQMLCGGVCAPLVFLFLFRSMGGGTGPAIRYAALSGGFLGFSFLSGHHQIPMFIALAAAGCWVWHVARNAGSRVVWLAVSAFCVMTLVAGAVQILPANEYGRHAVRWVGASHPLRWNEMVPYSVLERYSLPPVALLSTVVRDLSDNTTAYTGWTALLMAAAGAVVSWRETAGRLLTFIAAGGMLLAFGSETVFHGVLYALVPDFNKARTIGFAVFLFGFGAAVLAAYGLDRFCEAPVPVRRVLVWIAVVGGVLFVGAPQVIAHTRLPRTLDFRAIEFGGMLALTFSILLAAWNAGKLRRPAIALTLLSVVELGAFVGYGYQRRDRPGSLLNLLTEHRAIAAWLKQQPEPVRAEIDQNEIPYNFCDWYGIDTLDVLIPSLTTNFDSVRGYYWARMILGANFYIGAQSSRPNQIERYRDARGIAVFENPDAFPRVWTVHRARTAGPDGMGAAIDRAGADLRSVALFDGNPPELEDCSGDNVGGFRRGANWLEFDVEMKCRGLTIAGEVYDRGWRATVDGRVTPVMETDGVLRGVVVPAGHHALRLYYRPVSVIAGAILTGIGTVVMTVLAFL